MQQEFKETKRFEVSDYYAALFSEFIVKYWKCNLLVKSINIRNNIYFIAYIFYADFLPSGTYIKANWFFWVLRYWQRIFSIHCLSCLKFLLTTFTSKLEPVYQNAIRKIVRLKGSVCQIVFSYCYGNIIISILLLLW